MLKFFKKGLKKTSEKIAGGIDRITSLWGKKIGEETLENLEQDLIETDMGVETAMEIIDRIRSIRAKEDVREVLASVKAEMLEVLGREPVSLKQAVTGPTVILVIGINGTGKTTTIAKLAGRLKRDGMKVMLAACDTFRAAAVEQLQIWGARVSVDVIKYGQNADAAAVAFDAAEAAHARDTDYLIVDTAGRLHTKANLMEELKKIRRVLSKRIDGAPHETLLVLDATTGQNALVQAETFLRELNVTGLVLTKLDGSAKGGIVLAIRRKLGVPVKYVGLGEGLEDLQPFDPEEYVEALLGYGAIGEV